ncbi:MAG: DUF4333 domain-containing protein, partial [Microthrixaceae bacterium]
GAVAVACGSDDDSSGGSGTSTAGSTIEAGAVEDQVGANLAELGLSPDRVACPDDMTPEIGTTSRCEVELEGASYGVTVEVAATDRSQAVLDVTVDDEPS